MVTAIIQARMASTRLPGKVLKLIQTKSIFAHLVERLRYCKCVKKIVLATSNLPENDPLAEAAKFQGIDVYRGSETDVLDRFYQAAKTQDAHAIMRVTADCPLLDPGICDRVMEVFEVQKADYAFTGPSFCEGLDCEVFSFVALETAWRNADRPSEREHVTLYFRNHPRQFQIARVDNPTDDSRYRITVDTAEDFQVVQTLFENLSHLGQQPFGVEAIKKFLDTHPETYCINAHIIRNEGLLRSLHKESDDIQHC